MKSEFDLLRKEAIPSDLLQIRFEVLEVYRKLWAKDVYLKSQFHIEWSGDGYVYNVASSRFTIMSKAELDEDYAKYLANEHAENVKTVIENPDYEPAVYEEEDDECWDDEPRKVLKEAVGDQRITIDADVVEIADINGLFGCDSAQAFAIVFKFFDMVKVLKSDGRMRAYVCLGEHGFIAKF